jgi:hypothetical protein
MPFCVPQNKQCRQIYLLTPRGKKQNSIVWHAMEGSSPVFPLAPCRGNRTMGHCEGLWVREEAESDAEGSIELLFNSAEILQSYSE